MKPRAPVIAALGLAVAGAAYAHHGPGKDYDTLVPIELTGRVTGIEWINPHTRVHLTVRTAGKDQAWVVEAGTPNTLVRSGVSPETLASGLDITVRGFRSRDGRCDPECTAYGREMDFPGGRKVYLGMPRK